MAQSGHPDSLAEYQYDLPENRIARYPLEERDQSKLLIWKDGQILHKSFTQLCDYLPVNATLFFNNTKVIPARILFQKETGAIIEVFLLNPAGGASLAEALQATGKVTWKCAIGNARRWNEKVVLQKKFESIVLSAQKKDRDDSLVTLSWTPTEVPFAKIIDQAGAIPLPPYLHREQEEIDRERYQTVYSVLEGAVAAPTAGLHFTPAVIDQLAVHGMKTDFLTLHVSAGTFLPMKTANPADHRMHNEEILIYKRNIINLLQTDQTVVAVGTTALRSLESIYWFGVFLDKDPEAAFVIPQELPVQTGQGISVESALKLILKRMENDRLEVLTGQTSIYIMPGYRFRLTKGLITNFHQPGSTLLVLVSAFVGPAWKKIYGEAMAHQYRFLSYGDSSLLFPGNELAS